MAINQPVGSKKTKPIQSQTKPILFSPQIFWGLKDQVEKTKPICGRVKLAQSLI